MSAACAIQLVIAVAGVLAGAEPGTFLGAAFGAALAAWRAHLAPAAGADRLFATLDPEAPDEAVLLEAVRAALDRIRRTGRAVLLRISTFTVSGRPRLRLGLTRDGDLEFACDGRRSRPLGQPGVWIADHPLPLALPRTRCLTLRLAPAGGGRVRASPAAVPPLSHRAWTLAALLAAAACALDAAALLAATLGFAFQTRLSEHHARRAERQP
jgi:hypothetical protein